MVTNRRPASASASTGSGRAGAPPGPGSASGGPPSPASGSGWRTKAGKLWRPSGNDSASIRQSCMCTASARNSPCSRADHITDRVISPAVRKGPVAGVEPADGQILDDELPAQQVDADPADADLALEVAAERLLRPGPDGRAEVDGDHPDEGHRDENGGPRDAAAHVAGGTTIGSTSTATRDAGPRAGRSEARPRRRVRLVPVR